MDTRTQDRVEDWDGRPFSDGFDGLRDLADGEFTGAVEGAGTWLFMLNGRVVGVFDGTVDAFEDASGTAYRAPDPALVMLCTMWETGGETKAKYYTNDTPVEEVDDTLSSGSFTGYIELSENVLSGDYYVCYYGGRSLPVAFVGNSEQLLTGSEAFDRANDEVGIYEVRDVEISVVDIPEPEEPDADGAGAGVAGAGADTDTAASDIDTDQPSPATGTEHAASETADGDVSTSAGDAADDGPSVTANIRADQDPTSEADLDTTADDVVAAPPADDDPEPRTDAGASENGPPDSEPERRSAPSDSTPDRGSDPESGSERRSEPDRTDRGRSGEDRREDGETRGRADEASREPGETRGRSERARRGDRDGADRGTRTSRTDRTDTDRGSQGRSAEGPGAERSSGSREAAGETGAASSGDPLASPNAGAGGETGGSDDRLEREAQWRETTTIPSIDPDNSSEGDGAPADDGSGSAVAAPPAGRSEEPDGGAATNRGGRTADRRRETAGEPLEREMLEREDKIDRLQQQVSDLEAERDELRAEAERLRAEAENGADADRLREENDRLESENRQLREQVSALESEVESLESEVDRLESALEEARASEPEPETPSGQQLSPAAAMAGTNLFVRYDSKGEDTLADAHSGTATKGDVNGNLRLEHHTSFDADDVVVAGRPYETFLRESIVFGYVDWVVRTLLFEVRDTGNQDALRDLYDTLPKIDRAELGGGVELDPDDEADVPAEIGFDVVLRNRMGAPLIVANVNESRDPATEEMMVNLNEDASAVKERHDDFVGAFMVTTSFFSPGALETADEATSGSLLSRDSRKSFVKLSRKRGYHLCLVETRDGNFHVNVPEL